MSFEVQQSTRPSDVGPERGEVFTRSWVVDLILDLAGYTPDRDLAAMVAVEPACGAGAFLGPMVDRLVASCKRRRLPLAAASEAIRAYDLLLANVETARKVAAKRLLDHGLPLVDAERLAAGWVNCGDFLLIDHEYESADFVVGNPPYIRLENLPAWRNASYRRACPAMRGRSDIFVGFIEMGLRLLRSNGVLGYIVADRWMRNQYGAGLRKLIVNEFAVDAIIEMHDVDAFEDDVAAYPAITFVRRKKQKRAVVASTTRAFGQRDAARLRRWIRSDVTQPLTLPSVHAARVPGWFSGEESWPSGTPEQLATVADIEKRCPPLEDLATGTRVGIGLATGADDVLLTNTAVVEAERLLPMVMSRDLAGGQVAWSGTHLINPWDEGGRLVDLSQWPRLWAHLEANADRLRGRHTARRQPDRWYRTIDRVVPGLLERPKLLLPEMKASAHPVLEDGRYYPHHNLYYVTSTAWDLEVLGGLMLSDVTNLMVGTYCVKMRGGCYRFQAQYLRRIRVPTLTAVSQVDRRSLARAFEQRDVEAATAVAMRLYGLAELPGERVTRRASA